jgi:hypothetical protein
MPSKWRRRFAERRLAGLFDELRPGTPRKIGDEAIALTIRLTLETTPPGATHWSLRSHWSLRWGAGAVGYAPSTIYRIWRAFGLQPHRTESFKLSTDPLFVEKVRDIVGLYMAPPERALVLCVDEKSQIQALDRSQPLLPPSPGDAYRPSGAAHPRRHAARHHLAVRRARYRDWGGDRALLPEAPIERVQEVPRSNRGERAVRSRGPPRAGQLRHAQDQANPRLVGQAPALACPFHPDWRLPSAACWPRSFQEADRWPPGHRWINQVERFFANLTEQQIRRGVHRSTQQLEHDIRAFIDAHNAEPKPFRWTEAADDILASIQRFCLRTQQIARTSESGH